MNDLSSDTSATTSDFPPRNRGVNKASFIVNILNRDTHNHRAYRMGSELCPGIRESKWRTGDLASHGYLEILRIRLARLEVESEPNKSFSPNGNWIDANLAAGNGFLEVVRVLRAHGIHCTEPAANYAAGHGHTELVRDLLAHGVHFTRDSANWAASDGHIEVIRDLRAHGIHCTSFGADRAAANGHLDVIRDLRENGVHCTPRGADWAASNGDLAVVQDLEAHGIHRSPEPDHEFW